MIEVADIFHQHAGQYINQFGQSMLPSHLRAMQDIMACRTEALGGHVYCCDHCGEYTYSFHSCKNRSCPKCHTKQTQQWLEKRQFELLPVPYFHITLTIPQQLRALFRSNQKVCYSILMKSASQALQELAMDPQYCGGKVAILAVLHTWTQKMTIHPHVHCLVSAGGLSSDGQSWLDSSAHYLVPVKALSKLFRGKCLAALRDAFPEHIFLTPDKWVVNCKPWGKGETAILDYLARYVFRTAMTNCRILSMNEQGITFRYKDRKAKRWRTCQISPQEFIRRFLQHVLPKGFHKVRYYGLWHPSQKAKLRQVQLLLTKEQGCYSEIVSDAVHNDAELTTPTESIHKEVICPHCKKGHLVLIKKLFRGRAMSP